MGQPLQYSKHYLAIDLSAENYVTGSMEFHTAYAVSRKILLTLDSGHFHPTETIADKISSLLLYLDQILLHVSRGVRWDSDHVVTFTDNLQAIAQEIIRCDALEGVQIGLDYFDASINRIAAWAIGARSTLRALLAALLDPRDRLQEMEAEGDYSSRLALQEELKAMPTNAVWDYYCAQKNMPIGMDFMQVVREYESRELSRRSRYAIQPCKGHLYNRLLAANDMPDGYFLSDIAKPSQGLGVTLIYGLSPGTRNSTSLVEVSRRTSERSSGNTRFWKRSCLTKKGSALG